MAFQTIDEYITTFPEDIQHILWEMRHVIRESAPELEETISYQMPTFKLNGRNLVHFSAYKEHIGFYPAPFGIMAFEKELSSYKRSCSSLWINRFLSSLLKKSSCSGFGRFLSIRSFQE